MILSESPKNIFVTGAAGYIGTQLVARLCRSGYRVFGVDITEPTFVHKNFHFNVVDLLDDQARQRVFEDLVKSSGCQGKSFLLFHLAGISDAGKCEKNPEKCYEVNCLLVREIFDCATNVGITRYIFLSSAQVYGVWNSTELSEASALRPGTVYGQMKAHAEEKLRKCFEQTAITVDVVRLSNIYGGPLKKGTVMGDIHDQIKGKKSPIEVFDRRPIRDFIHINDVIEGLLRIMLTQSGRNFDVINLGTGKGISIGRLIVEMTNVFQDVTQESGSVEEDFESNSDRVVLRIERLITRTKWRPSIGIRTGLQIIRRVS